ncbi:MAG: helix-turn-helix domain-containing protein [Actinomycetota bacterium]
MSFGSRFKAARERAGLTQAELAGDGYSVAYVSRIESGERTPSPEALAVFAKRLGISPDSLLAPIDVEQAFALEQRQVESLRALEAGEWQAAKESATTLLEMARALESKRHEAVALRCLGEAEEFNGDPEDALAHYENALSRLPDQTVEEQTDLVVRVARMHRRLGDLGVSGDMLERQIAALESTKDLYPALMARLHLHLSATCSERGDLARARRTGLSGVEFARAAGDTRTLANALWAAAPPMVAANPARALSLIRRAGTLYAELGSLVELGRLHVEMGVVALEAGDLVTARTALDRAEELMGNSITTSVRSTILQTRADIELREGNSLDAVRYAREAIAVAEGVEPLEQARARRSLGQALISQDPEAAERELRMAIELFTSAGAQMESARCFRSLGDLLVAAGRQDDALRAYREGLGQAEGAA